MTLIRTRYKNRKITCITRSNRYERKSIRRVVGDDELEEKEVGEELEVDR
nr:11400_t:CDS:2 [Entrophospora candida]